MDSFEHISQEHFLDVILPGLQPGHSISPHILSFILVGTIREAKGLQAMTHHMEKGVAGANINVQQPTERLRSLKVRCSYTSMIKDAQGAE